VESGAGRNARFRRRPCAHSTRGSAQQHTAFVLFRGSLDSLRSLEMTCWVRRSAPAGPARDDRLGKAPAPASSARHDRLGGRSRRQVGGRRSFRATRSLDAGTSHSAIRNPQSAFSLPLTPHPLPNKAFNEPTTKLSTMSPPQSIAYPNSEFRNPHSAIRILLTPHWPLPSTLNCRR
jgi:hypothetical protein